MTKAKFFTIASGVFLAVGLIAMIYFVAKRELGFKSEGMKTYAKVLDKFIESKKKGKNFYKLKVSFSADPKNIIKKEPKKEEKKNKTMDEIISGIGGDYSSVDLSNSPITTVISVDYDEYNSMYMFAKIEIYYLKSNPTEARLAQYVED